MPIVGDWFREDYVFGAGTSCTIDRLLFSGRTAYQDVLIFENRFFGKTLVLDGVIQTTTSDDAFYHEMLVHVPLVAHGAVGEVLIVGGGDGGALREVLRHSGTIPTLVDIDPELIELCRLHLPEICHGAFDDPRATCFAGDGFEFVASSRDLYDAILCDATDPLGGPGDPLYSADFIEACKRRLRPGGVIVVQSGVPDHEPERHKALHCTLASVFRDVGFYVVPVPSYFGGFMSFGWGSDDAAVRGRELDAVRRRFANCDIRTRYYTPEIHRAAFTLPQYFIDIIGE